MRTSWRLSVVLTWRNTMANDVEVLRERYGNYIHTIAKDKN